MATECEVEGDSSHIDGEGFIDDDAGDLGELRVGFVVRVEEFDPFCPEPETDVAAEVKASALPDRPGTTAKDGGTSADSRQSR